MIVLDVPLFQPCYRILPLESSVCHKPTVVAASVGPASATIGAIAVKRTAQYQER